MKGETHFSYSILDAEKIEGLELSAEFYNNIKTALGLIDEYAVYDLSITINSPSYQPFTYGTVYEHADVVVSVTRNVLIYHPPQYGLLSSGFDDFIAPYYENGQITVRMFKGGYLPE